MDPLVSVVIPAYNREKYIKRAIKSVLSQDYQNIEIIITDDGSTDNTRDAVCSFKDKRIKYICQENQGVSSALNKGIDFASGKYVATLHSDDYWIDDKKTAKQVSFLEKNSDYLMAGSGYINVTENGKEVSRVLNPETDEEIKKNMLFSCLFAASSALIRKETLRKIGGFDKNLKVGEDWDLLMKMGKLGKLYNFQEYFVCYQFSEKSLSNAYYRRSLKNNLILTKKYKKDYPFFQKAMFLRRLYYFYSFLPFNQRLLLFFSKIKKLIFGEPAFKIIKK